MNLDISLTSVSIYVCKLKYKTSASAQNTIVAFHQEYSRYRYLYFTTGKQWSKDLLGNKGISINIPT